MKKEALKIDRVPAVIWGESSDQVVIAVHGDMSNKEDVPIVMFAEHAVSCGMQVISFDLPEHGDRKNQETLCKVQECVKDLKSIMNYAKKRWTRISLFANSMGAYFSTVTYQAEHLEHAWFLSPLVDMQRMIENMMKWFDISDDRLQKEQTIETPIGKKVYWDYYCYVKEHPVVQWKVRTDILRGTKDQSVEYDTLTQFASRYSDVSIELAQGSEHYFHTDEQLRQLDQWLTRTLG